MKVVQTKNSIDVPTIINSLRELGILSAIVGGLFFLEGLQVIDFSVYSPIIVAAAKVLVELLREYRKGVEA